MVPRTILFAGHLKPRLPKDLKRLLQLVPKTEQHLHLSGSARKADIAVFMQENGLTPEQAKEELKLIKPAYKDLTDILVTYYSVPKHVYTPSQFKRAAMGIVKEAAKENVRVLEIRSSVLKKGGPPEEIIEAIEAGMREGMAWVKKYKHYNMKTALIILAQRAGSPEESLTHAKLAIKMAKKPGSLIRGFDIAGDEIKHAIDTHKKTLQYFKRYGKSIGLSLTVHAGEVPVSENNSGLESIRKAIAYGADRIGHGIQVILDPLLKKHFAKHQTPLELCPWSNVQIGAVDSYAEHPIKPLLEAGLNVNLNTDNRMVSQITLTKQLGQLWQHGLVTTWDQIKKLTLNGVRSSFIPEIDKKRVEKEVRANFKVLESRFATTIQKYLSNKKPKETQSA